MSSNKSGSTSNKTRHFNALIATKIRSFVQKGVTNGMKDEIIKLVLRV